MLEKTRDLTSETKVYLDHNATTPVSGHVLNHLLEAANSWGNPSSIHGVGRGPKTLIREARQALAKALGVGPLEIIFTSGGSEANSTVIKSVFDQVLHASAGDKLLGRLEFITSEVEHPSVKKAMAWIEKRGAKVFYLKVNRDGEIDLDQYQKFLSPRTALVSVMCANNETGTLFPIREMAQLAQAQGALFHSDCVQALGKIPLSLDTLGVDYASFSAHKFYALKGAGILFCRKGRGLEPLILGGGQERGRRGGTENTLGIWAMGVMAEKLSEVFEKNKKLSLLRDRMESRILSEIPFVKVTAAKTSRLPNTSSLVLEGVDGETLLMSLDLKGFAVSTGAACSSGSPEPSPVLLSMGLSRQEAQNSLRLSLGWGTTPEQIDAFVDTLKSVVARLRSLSVSHAEEARHV